MKKEKGVRWSKASVRGRDRDREKVQHDELQHGAA